MSHKSGALGLVGTKGKQHTLASVGILALVMGLLALALAVVVVVVVMPLAGHEVSPGTVAGAEAVSSRCSVSGEPYAADSEGNSGVYLAKATEPGEAFVRSVALTGQSPAGYAVAGPCNAPICTLSMSPTEAEAYAGSLALAAHVSDEAFVRSVALTGQSLVGYAVAGPCGTPYCTLSMSSTETQAYAASLALAAQASDEAFVRSVALTGQSLVGHAVAGPCGTPYCTLSMSSTEAEAYAASLALAAHVSNEAFVRSVALTGQNLVGYAVAGPCGTPYCTLSMSPTEAEAYAASLALMAQASDEAFVRSVALTGQNLVGYAVAGPCGTPYCTLSMAPAEAEAYAGSLALAAQASDEAFVRSVALTGQNLAGFAVAGPCSAPYCTLSMSPIEAGAYAASLALAAQVSDDAFVRSVALTGQNLAGYVVAGPCGTPYCTLSMSPTEAEAYAGSLALAAQASDEAFVRSVALTGQNLATYAAAGPCSAPYCTLSMSPTEAEAYARSVLLAGQGSAGMVGGQ